MFPAEKEGQWEPNKIRRRRRPNANHSTKSPTDAAPESNSDDFTIEEDLDSDTGAVWPMEKGKIVDWPCFFALMEHVFESLNGSFHMPIMLLAQPAWSTADHSRITKFIFEKFKCPAFALLDTAQATAYAYGLQTACVVDIGYEKADVTAIVEHLTQEQGRAIAVSGCGGEAMTQQLYHELKSERFTRDMSEQLKLSSICEILPPGTPLPGTQKSSINGVQSSNTITTEPPAPSKEASKSDAKPRRAQDGENLTEQAAPVDDENEGVIDVANIVTSNNMNEIIQKKEQEKAEKQASRKKAGNVADPPKPVRLKNSEKEFNTFIFHDRAARERSKEADLNGTSLPDGQPSPPTGSQNVSPVQGNGTSEDAIVSPIGDPGNVTTSPKTSSPTNTSFPIAQGQVSGKNPYQRSITVGTQRFNPLPPSYIPLLTSAIRDVIQSVPSSSYRQPLWDNLLITGAGSRIRGFKEALISSLSARYTISPSSATIFTSELPSNLSTPGGTGANTPQPQPAMPHYSGGQLSMGGNRNSLLHAATTASASQLGRPPNGIPGHVPGQQHLTPGGQYTGASSVNGSPAQFPPSTPGNYSSGQIPRPGISGSGGGSHSQAPTTIKVGKLPEYFAEWKEPGVESEAMFLGAQVASKVFFLTDVHVSYSVYGF